MATNKNVEFPLSFLGENHHFTLIYYSYITILIPYPIYKQSNIQEIELHL